MTFNDAIKKLGIEQYGERIFNSNSHGELFHIVDYIVLAENISDCSCFKDEFEEVVKYAEENWVRPESIFQYILKIFLGEMEDLK